MQIVEAYAKGGTDGLTEVEFVEVMRAVLLENTAFNQNVSFAAVLCATQNHRGMLV